MSSESFRQQVCSSSSSILLLMHHRGSKLQRFDPDCRLAQEVLSRRRWQGIILFSNGSLHGWFAQVGADELQAAENYSCYFFEFAFFK
jgi:hypothetical protein